LDYTAIVGKKWIKAEDPNSAEDSAQIVSDASHRVYQPQFVGLITFGALGVHLARTF